MILLFVFDGHKLIKLIKRAFYLLKVDMWCLIITLLQRFINLIVADLHTSV